MSDSPNQTTVSIGGINFGSSENARQKPEPDSLDEVPPSPEVNEHQKYEEIGELDQLGGQSEQPDLQKPARDRRAQPEPSAEKPAEQTREEVEDDSFDDSTPKPASDPYEEVELDLFGGQSQQPAPLPSVEKPVEKKREDPIPDDGQPKTTKSHVGKGKGPSPARGSRKNPRAASMSGLHNALNRKMAVLILRFWFAEILGDQPKNGKGDLRSVKWMFDAPKIAQLIQLKNVDGKIGAVEKKERAKRRRDRRPHSLEVEVAAYLKSIDERLDCRFSVYTDSTQLKATSAEFVENVRELIARRLIGQDATIENLRDLDVRLALRAAGVPQVDIDALPVLSHKKSCASVTPSSQNASNSSDSEWTILEWTIVITIIGVVLYELSKWFPSD